MAQMELHYTLVPEAFRGGWADASSKVSMFCFSLKVVAEPKDREYADFALFLEADVDDGAKDMVTELYLKKGRTVKIQLISRGQVEFEVHQLTDAMRFQEKVFRIMLGPKSMKDFQPNWDPAILYLILPMLPSTRSPVAVDWKCVRTIVTEVVPGSLPLFQTPMEDYTGDESYPSDHKSQSRTCAFLQMANGPISQDAVVNSLVENTHDGKEYIIVSVKDNHSSVGDDHSDLRDKPNVLRPKKVLLEAKQLKKVENLLFDRTKTGPDKQSGSVATKEVFMELRPESCCVQVLGFSSQVVNTVSLIPSFMHSVAKFLLATQLQKELEAAFNEAAMVPPKTVLQALTRVRCQESSNLGRLAFYGDSFLKFAVSKRLFLVLDKACEGELTKMLEHDVSNPSLHERGVAHSLPIYIHDECFNPVHWSAPGRLYRVHCDADNRALIKCSGGNCSLEEKAVADSVEALIGAHLVNGGSESALAFMKWVGISVDFDNNLISEASTRCAGDIQFIQGKDLSELEKILRYSFQNRSILVEALTHGSLRVLSQYSYQRLEFLGDAVLGYLITRHLYENLPHFPPGLLTDLKIATVRNDCFADVTVRYHLQNFLLHNCPSFTEAINKFVISREAGKPFYGWEDKSPKVLGDVLESLAGAVLVDTAFDAEKVWSVFEPFLQPIVTREKLCLHPARELRELCEKKKFKHVDIPTWKGAQRVVEWTVNTGKETIVSQAERPDTESANRAAACEMLEKLKNLGWQHGYHDLKAALFPQDKADPPGEVSEGCNLGHMGHELKYTEVMKSDSLEISPEIAGDISQEISEDIMQEISQVNLVESFVGGDQQDNAELRMGSNSVTGLELSEMSRSASSSSLECLPTCNILKSIGAEHGGLPGKIHKLDVSYGGAPTDLRDMTRSRQSDAAAAEENHVDELDKNFLHLEARSCKPSNDEFVTDEIISPEASFVKQGDPSTIYTPSDSSHFQPAVYDNGNIDSIDSRGDVQILLDALLGHPFLEHGTVGAGVASTTGKVKEEILNGATQTLDAVNGLLNREYTMSSSSLELENNVSGSSVHSNSSDENVGKPRADLNELCAKYRWTEPKYKLCPGYPEGPSHEPRFAFFVSLSCWLRNAGSAQEYEIKCRGEPRKDKRRARDSAASSAIAWLQDNFVSGQIPVQTLNILRV